MIANKFPHTKFVTPSCLGCRDLHTDYKHIFRPTKFKTNIFAKKLDIDSLHKFLYTWESKTTENRMTLNISILSKLNTYSLTMSRFNIFQ